MIRDKVTSESLASGDQIEGRQFQPEPINSLELPIQEI